MLAVLACLAVLVLPVPPSRAATAEPSIVVLRSIDASVAQETAERERRLGFSARHEYRAVLDGFAARLTPAQKRALRSDPEVAAVVPDRPVRALGDVALAAGEPVPPPGVRRIGAATLVSVRQAASAAVAVVDTGLDLGHPDLDAAAGTNCISSRTPPQDDNGHGTHVAGTIAARNDGGGVVGVAPGTRVYAVKVLDAGGSGSTSSVVCGLDWVKQNAVRLGIRVVNMSLGGPGPRTSCPTASDPEHQAICDLAAAGVITVAAAGNDGADIAAAPDGEGGTAPTTPAVHPEVLTVSAMTDTDGLSGGLGIACRAGGRDDVHAGYSNYATRAADSAHVIAGPGSCIRSTVPVAVDEDGLADGYAVYSGTSMATPHVAGLVALCIGEAGAAGPCANRSAAEVVAHMISAAAARTAGGFLGDPLSPVNGRVYGPLARLVAVSPPTVSAAAPAVDELTATLRGTVEAGGQITVWRLEAGPTLAYGTTVATGTVTAADGTAAVAGNLTLEPGRRTYWRLVATNASGTAATAGQFLDAPAVETPVPPPATEAAGPAADTGASQQASQQPPQTPATAKETAVPAISAWVPSAPSLRALTRAAGLAVRLTCPESCRATVTLVAGRRDAARLRLGRRRTLARTAGRVDGRRTLRLVPSRAVRTRLARLRILKLTLVVRSVAADGAVRVVRRPVVLRAQR